MRRSSRHVSSDRHFHVPVGRDAVWTALCDVDAYPTWWPWLTEFDAGSLAAGEMWACTVRSPLRVVLRFRVCLDDVVAGERVAATVSGDVAGAATLRLVERDHGSEIHLVSVLSPRSPAIGLLTATVPPLASWAHDRLIGTAARQFARAVGAPAVGAPAAVSPAMPAGRRRTRR